MRRTPEEPRALTKEMGVKIDLDSRTLVSIYIHPLAGYVEFEMISFSGCKFSRKTLSLIYLFSM